MKKILVLGVGNILLGDDGVGVHVVERMKRMALPGDAELLDGGMATSDLIPYMKGRQKVIIIDAILSSSPAGTIFRIPYQDMKKGQHYGISALHQIGVIEMLQLLESMGNMPDILIIGIVPKNDTEFSQRLSPEIEEKLPEIIAKVLEELSVE
ncbi:MAG: hydrogenase maturation protease [bacterium]